MFAITFGLWPPGFPVSFALENADLHRSLSWQLPETSNWCCTLDASFSAASIFLGWAATASSSSLTCRCHCGFSRSHPVTPSNNPPARLYTYFLLILCLQRTLNSIMGTMSFRVFCLESGNHMVSWAGICTWSSPAPRVDGLFFIQITAILPFRPFCREDAIEFHTEAET